ncbi:MAG TPA: VOC family protein [Candidatus Binatia bacterium]|jgi:catechol 2,3-dioxygenase-like lactoylglutathione lyase family enzyme
MRLRQVALVARDLEAVVADCCAVLGLEVAFRDPEIATFGLRNALMPIGDTFLEVVSPVREDATAARFLERRRGDGGYMVIVQTDDLDAARARLATLGVRVVFDVAFDDVATLHLHPRDVGGAILSLDVARPPESWRWAGPVWRAHVRTDVSAAIAGVEIQAADPAAMAARWSAILERPSREGGPGTYLIPLDDGVIRLVRARDERGDGVAGLDVRVHDRARALASAHARGLATTAETVMLGGVRVRLC